MLVDKKKYVMALTVLNSMVGIYFCKLNTEKNLLTSDQLKIDQLKAKFQEYYTLRMELGRFDDVQLQKIIDDNGPQVQEIVSALNHGGSEG